MECAEMKVRGCSIHHPDPRCPPYIRCNSREAFDLSSSFFLDKSNESQRRRRRRKHHNNNTIECSSNDGPTMDTTVAAAAAEINKSLNLNLGLPFDPTKSNKLRLLFRLLSNLLSIFEHRLFALWTKIPLKWRQRVTILAWKIYFPIHRILLGRRTGIHPDASLEYHAITTFMYWSRLLPVSLERMRFSLGQLNVMHAPQSYPPLLNASSSSSSSTLKTTTSTKCSSSRKRRPVRGFGQNISEVWYDMQNLGTIDIKGQRKKDGLQDRVGLHEENGNFSGHRKETVVTGYFIQNSMNAHADDIENSNSSNNNNRHVIFWIYGGAFLAGDSYGNLAFAEKISQQCNNADVFLPDYRLLPEYSFFDSLHDILLAYEYFRLVRGYQPENIILFGISSGAALAVRLLQTLSEMRRRFIIIPCCSKRKKEKAGGGEVTGENSETLKGEKKKETHHDHHLETLDVLTVPPAGALLMGPFVDYRVPKGSFKEYIAHDLVVNQAVFEEGVPYFERLGDNNVRHMESPVNRSFCGLPPLCIITSQHEVVYDQCVLLVNNARADGVDTTIGVWKYLCHVFPVLAPFLPEGQQAVDFMCDWIREHQSK